MRTPIYTGSVKNLFEAGKGTLEFEFTDAYSVFDWGRMPDALEGKGEALAAITTYFYEKFARGDAWKQWSESLAWRGFVAALEKSHLALPQSFLEVFYAELEHLKKTGLRTHFKKRIGPRSIEVAACEVSRPVVHQWFGSKIYDYSARAERKNSLSFVPLEVVFRFGTPSGSSLPLRATPDYLREVGLTEKPAEGQHLEHPVVEFFSKLEPKDRHLSAEMALGFSGLDFVAFQKLTALTFAVSFAIHLEFSRIGLELWDGKVEWAVQDGEPVLVDSIGPDELRLTQNKFLASKEFLREHYRKTKWFDAIEKAKVAPHAGDTSWKDRVLADFGPPPALPKEKHELASRLYPSIAWALTGENPKSLGIALGDLISQVTHEGHSK